MRLDGTLPFVRVGATIRFRPADIASWIDTNTEGAPLEELETV